MILFNSSKRTKRIINQIHTEFDTAQDKLLAEAKRILENRTIRTVEETMYQKANNLEELGFKRAQEVTKVKKLLEEKNLDLSTIKVNEELAKLVEKYKVHYPTIKFITLDILDSICNKYKLIHGPVEYYTGSVPDKNIKDLNTVLYNLRSEDLVSYLYTIQVPAKELSQKCPDHVKRTLTRSIQIWTSTDYLKSLSHALNILYPNIDYQDMIKDYSPIYNQVQHNVSGLYIAAPRNQFDMKELVKTSKRTFLKPKFSLIKDDPIVFRYIRGGAQVLTKWGPEANDQELVVNEREN